VPSRKLFTVRYSAGLKHAIKTAIAAVSCVYLARWLKIPEAYWAVITAIIVLQSNIGATLNASWTRLIGTAIGAVTGGVFVEFVGTGALAFGLALVLVVMICDFSGLTDSYRLAGVTLAIVMLINRLGPTWIVAGERFLQVALGIIVGVIVSIAIWPSRARESLRAGLADALTGMGVLFQSVVQSIHGGSAAEIETQRATVKDILRKGLDLRVQAAHELSATVDQASITLLMDLADRVMEAIEALEISARGSFEGTFHLHFKEETEQLEREISAGLKLLAQSTRNWQFDAAWPDFVPIILKLEDHVASVRASGSSAKYPLEEVLCFYTFLFSLKNLARELQLAHAATNRITKSTPSV